MGQTLGRDTVLECVIVSSPQAIYYWEKDGRRITSSSKHAVDAYDEADHTLVLSLRVRHLTPSDYGTYNCVASNSLGVAQRAMTLYGRLVCLNYMYGIRGVLKANIWGQYPSCGARGHPL